MRPSLPVLGLLLLGPAACADRGAARPWWIAPLDGHTGVGTTAPLRVVGPVRTWPADYPAAPWITVVDLHDGGLVPGSVVDDEDGVAFVPDAPWARGRYVWTIDDPQEAPHGPEVALAAAETGSAAFDTRTGLRVLDAGSEPEGRGCLVLSDMVSGDRLGGVRVTIDGEDTGLDALEVLSPDTWAAGVDASVPRDASVVCLPGDVPVELGALVRVWFDGDGPWLVEVTDASPGALFAARHRLWTEGTAP